MRRSLCFTVLAVAVPLSGCATFGTTQRSAEIEVSKVIASIECELAAAGREDPSLGGWGAKSTLSLTNVATVKAEAGVVLVSSSITPGIGVQTKDTLTTQTEFLVSVSGSINGAPDFCKQSDDPSGTRLGLAAWLLAATAGLRSQPNFAISGVTYTREFELLANPSARFGFTFVPNTGSATVGYTGLGNHRLVVALTPPRETPATRVVIVGYDLPRRTASHGQPKSSKANRTFSTIVPTEIVRSVVPVQRNRRRQKVNMVPSIADDRSLNRLLDQQQPVRLQPGSGL